MFPLKTLLDEYKRWREPLFGYWSDNQDKDVKKNLRMGKVCPFRDSLPPRKSRDSLAGIIFVSEVNKKWKLQRF